MVLLSVKAFGKLVLRCNKLVKGLNKLATAVSCASWSCWLSLLECFDFASTWRCWWLVLVQLRLVFECPLWGDSCGVMVNLVFWFCSGVGPLGVCSVTLLDDHGLLEEVEVVVGMDLVEVWTIGLV